MKFLCVSCDQAMKLVESRGPDRGSLTAIFGCPACGRQTALLTNPWETQVVRSMDVKIGGRSVPPEPMESLRESLESAPKKCPFSDTAKRAVGTTTVQDVLPWTEAARVRLERIPSFVRPMAKAGIEKLAKENGFSEVNDEVLNQAKEKFGM